MELYDYERLVDPLLVDHPPTEPGLYLYARDGSTYVDLVAVREEKGRLIADSDHWFTWMPVEDAAWELPGKWSKCLVREHIG